ncbi:MAG: hypothetical protein DMF60_04035 [Acidobacteria bacterium]|nr:MAG: hypothetical protein DMF60_04035 [Acidobacteriota bacterium]
MPAQTTSIRTDSQYPLAQKFDRETLIRLMKGRSVVSRVTVDATLGGGAAMVKPPWSIMNH